MTSVFNTCIYFSAKKHFQNTCPVRQVNQAGTTVYLHFIKSSWAKLSSRFNKSLNMYKHTHTMNISTKLQLFLVMIFKIEKKNTSCAQFCLVDLLNYSPGWRWNIEDRKLFGRLLYIAVANIGGFTSGNFFLEIFYCYQIRLNLQNCFVCSSVRCI